MENEIRGARAGLRKARAHREDLLVVLQPSVDERVLPPDPLILWIRIRGTPDTRSHTRTVPIRLCLVPSHSMFEDGLEYDHASTGRRIDAGIRVALSCRRLARAGFVLRSALVVMLSAFTE